MAVSLDSLPLELVLLVFELGPLEIKDAMGLRSICKKLFAITETRIFWVCMAKIHKRYRPLPTPPHRPDASLTVKELQQACFRAHHTMQNIASERPAYKKHRILALPDRADPVEIIQLLPGGLHAIMIHGGGLVVLWDLRASASSDSPALKTIVTALVNQDAHRAPAPTLVGKCLAMYNPGYEIESMDCVTSGDHDETVTVAIIGAPVENSQAVLSVISFTFVSSDEVVMKVHCRQCINPDFVEMSVSDGLIIIASTHSDCTMDMLIGDYLEGRFVIVMTTIPVNNRYISGLLVTNDGDIIIYGGNPSGLVIKAFFDVGSTFLGTINQGLDTPHAFKKKIDPHASLILEYDSKFPSNRCWDSMHSWRTTHAKDRQMVSITTTMEHDIDSGLPPEDPQSLSMIMSQWLDIDEILKLLKAPTLAEPQQIRSLRPAMCKIRSPEASDASQGGFVDLFVRGTLGSHMGWITEDSQQGMLILEILPLDQESYQRSGQPLENLVRKLDVPIPLDDQPAVEFCDQFGMLAISHHDSTSGQNLVHVFDY